MKDEIFNPVVEETNEEIVKNIAKAVGKATTPIETNEELDFGGSAFKVCTNVLPEKTGLWTKVKNVLFYEIKVELTPYQQKIEDEINDFLHQEVTFKGFIDMFFKEITFGKKKN